MTSASVRLAANRTNDFACFRAVDLRWREGEQECVGVLDPRDKLFERRFLVLDGRRLDAGEPRSRAPGKIGCDLHLPA